MVPWLKLCWLMATLYLGTRWHRYKAVSALGELADNSGWLGRSIVVMALRVALNDSQPSVRRETARALGKLGDPRAVEPLIGALNDLDAEVRSNVAGALGKLGDPRAVEPLIGTLNDVSVRHAAADALGKLGDPRAVEPLIIVVRAIRVSLDRTTHYSNRRWLTPFGDDCIEYKDTPSLCVMIAALAKLRRPQAVPTLINALEDPSRTVRTEAARALGSLGDPRAIAPLMALTTHGDLQEEVTLALGNLNALSVDALLRALVESGSQKARYNVARRLVELGDHRAVDPLIELLTHSSTHSSAEVRAAAAHALGELRDRRAVEPLISALNDLDAEVRSNVAGALGKLGDRRAVKPLISRLNDSDATVRRAVVDALGYLGDPRAVEPLTRILLDRKRLLDKSNSRRILHDVVGALCRLGAIPTAPDLNLGYWSQEAVCKLANAVEKCAWQIAVPILLGLITNEFQSSREKWKPYGNAMAADVLFEVLKRDLHEMSVNLLTCITELTDIKALVSKGWESYRLDPYDDGYPLKREVYEETTYKNLSNIRQIAQAELSRRLAGNDRRIDVNAKNCAFESFTANPPAAAFSDSHSRVRAAIAKRDLAGCVREGAAAVDLLIAALNDVDGQRRQVAVEALGQLGDLRALEPLIAALKDSDKDVRWKSAEALGKLWDARAIKALTAAIEDSPDYYMQVAAEWALSTIRKS